MRQTDPESLPNRESTAKRRLFGCNCKQNRYTPPLKRFFESRVGNKWDAVYSELVSKQDKFSVPTYSIQEVSSWFVDRKIGNLDTFREFYVDVDGILRKTPQRYRKKRESLNQDINYINIDGETYGLRSDGMWYHILFKPIPEPRYTWVEKNICGRKYWHQENKIDSVYDLWFFKYYNNPELSPWKNGCYCDKYQQVGKKVLKKIKKALEGKKCEQ